ncbi:hypothetical protein [Demequina soli]|uniref:hypothetical protein n=1 Tax=Demequina soli TaxID=1638987 RepID=UPI0012E09D5E|nr:hypothetical protein [Demequina soli]
MGVWVPLRGVLADTAWPAVYLAVLALVMVLLSTRLLQLSGHLPVAVVARGPEGVRLIPVRIVVLGVLLVGVHGRGGLVGTRADVTVRLHDDRGPIRGGRTRGRAAVLGVEIRGGDTTLLRAKMPPHPEVREVEWESWAAHLFGGWVLVSVTVDDDLWFAS